jgi:hypothetical protein
MKQYVVQFNDGMGWRDVMIMAYNHFEFAYWWVKQRGVRCFSYRIVVQ